MMFVFFCLHFMDLCDFSLDMGSNDNIGWTRESLAGGCHKKPSSKVKGSAFFQVPISKMFSCARHWQKLDEFTRRSVSVVAIYRCHIDHRSSLLLPSFDIITCNIVISYHIVSYHILILCSIICHMSCYNIVSYTVILYHNIRWYCHIVILYTYIVRFKYDILSYVSYRIIYMRLIVVAILKMPDCTEHMYLVPSPKPATSKPGVGFVSVNSWI